MSSVLRVIDLFKHVFAPDTPIPTFSEKSAVLLTAQLAVPRDALLKKYYLPEATLPCPKIFNDIWAEKIENYALLTQSYPRCYQCLALDGSVLACSHAQTRL